MSNSNLTITPLNKQIKQYVRDTKGVKLGVLIAGTEDGKLQVGYCAVHPNDHGKFDGNLAKTIAIGRARAFSSRAPRYIPPQIKSELPSFAERCEKYFKDSTLPEWVNEAMTSNFPSE